MPTDDRPPIPVVLRIDPPKSGADNMAVDAALLEEAAAGSRIIVRLYRWQEPTLSLGHFQKREDLDADFRRIGETGASRLQALPWVHRKTGGGAIVHDQEWTYSLVIPHGCDGSDPVDRERGPVDRNKGHNERLYRAIHESIRDGLRAIGLRASLSEQCTCSVQPAVATVDSASRGEAFLCFQRRTPVDLVIGEHKVLGSAQRRNRSGLLQHGSLLLRASAHTPSLLGLEDLVGTSEFPDVRGRNGRHQVGDGQLDSVGPPDSVGQPVFNWGDWLVHRLREGLERVYRGKLEDWELKDSSHLVVS